MADSFRPLVSIAVICQSTLQETNGTLSVIRITDRIGVQGITDEMQPQALNHLTLAVILKAGFMKGKAKLQIVMHTPSGQEIPTTELVVLFEGDERGVLLVSPLMVIVAEEGLFWFDVNCEGEQLTRIPLRVIYQKIPQMPMPFPKA